jgi:hypothetical protein
MTVFAWVVDVKIMVRMFNQGKAQTLLFEQGYDFLK